MSTINSLKNKPDYEDMVAFIRERSHKMVKEIAEEMSEVFGYRYSSLKKTYISKIAAHEGIELTNRLTVSNSRAKKPTKEDVEANIESGNSCWQVDEEKGQGLFKADVEGVVDTLEQALEHCDADLETWEVKDWKTKKFNTTFKDVDGNARKTVNTSIHINFQRKGQSQEEAMKNFLDGISDRAPKKVKKVPKKKGNLLEIDIFDPHFGKDAILEEVGELYDLDIAEDRYMDALDTIVSRAERLENIERILFPIGNDWFHFDTLQKTTTKGTPMESKSKKWEIWQHGFNAAIRAITKISKVAPVDVLVVPSNHDYLSVLQMGHVLYRWFENDPNVNVDSRPIVRKYYRFHTNGIGFEHGDGQKESQIANTMLRETRDEWQGVKTMEFHVGHFHKRKDVNYPATTDEGGICVRYLRSLSGVDAWHFWKGFTKGTKGAEGFIYNKNEGLIHTLPYTLDI